MTVHRLAQKDLLLGGVYVAFGLVYGGSAALKSPMGTPTQMGPGFFPVVLCGILIAIGIGVALRGLFVRVESARVGPIAWRGLIAVSASTLLFAFIVNGAGIVISTFVTALVASTGSSRTRPLGAIVTALLLCAFCTGVFHYILHLPIGLLGSWFG